MSGRNPKFEWQDEFARSGTRGCSLAVGRAIADKWNGDSDCPFYSAEMLAEVTGYSVRQVRRALKQLQETDWIRQHSKGGRRGVAAYASRWRLTVPNVTPMSPNVTSVSSQRDTDVTPIDPGLDPYSLDPGAAPVLDGASAGAPPDTPVRASVECPWLLPGQRLCTPCDRPARCSQPLLHTVNGETSD